MLSGGVLRNPTKDEESPVEVRFRSCGWAGLALALEEQRKRVCRDASGSAPIAAHCLFFNAAPRRATFGSLMQPMMRAATSYSRGQLRSNTLSLWCPCPRPVRSGTSLENTSTRPALSVLTIDGRKVLKFLKSEKRSLISSLMKSGLVKFTKIGKNNKMSDSQIWLVNAYRFAGKRYRYTGLLTLTFTGKYGNIYKPSWLALLLLIFSKLN